MPINIDTKKDCCGCGACAAMCPTTAIAMWHDDEGFPVPHVDMDLCTNCGLCVGVCPWQEQSDLPNRIAPPKALAAWHLDENVRLLSSSGGAFSALAEDILARGGLVAGAAFDEELACLHVVIDTMTDLPRLRGSKYVQSRFDANLFSTIRRALEAGRAVLFSGTPCQVGGLRKYLGNAHDCLLCCDLVCHGVPSPLFFKKHINELKRHGRRVLEFSFRDKQQGWKAFRVFARWEHGFSKRVTMYDDAFVAAFLKNYSLRESCYACKFTTTERQGDLTIADFWGVANKHPEYDLADKGTSLLLVNSRKGEEWLGRCKHRLFLGDAELHHAIAGNPMLERPATRPPERNMFYKDASVMRIRQLRRRYRLYHPVPFWRRMLGKLKRGLVRTLKRPFVQSHS